MGLILLQRVRKLHEQHGKPEDVYGIHGQQLTDVC